VTDLSSLTDDELARRAYVEMDPLYTTDLERELLTRFEKLAQELAELAEFAALRAVLEEFEIGDADELKKHLKFATEAGDAIDDLAEPIGRLLNLTKE
jgi:transcription-repair coupling factor (superfamily II helicase)